MASPPIRLLLNPKAGAGAALRKLNALREALRRQGLEHDVAETSRPGDAGRLARVAREDGVQVLAVVGGDGTLNETVQAYIDEDGKPLGGPDLAVIPAGTGGDFKRSLGLSGSLEEAVGRLRSPGRPVDLGALRLVDQRGAPALRAFLNITSFGVGGHADQLVNEGPKWLGGKPAFFLGSLRATLGYRNQGVRVKVDGRVLYEGPAFNVAVANGRYFGGGMLVAPHADLSDGEFDVIVLGDLTLPEKLALAGSLYEGTHLAHRKILEGRGRVVEAEPLAPWSQVLIDMDGETPGRLALRAEVLPGALRLRFLHTAIQGLLAATPGQGGGWRPRHRASSPRHLLTRRRSGAVPWHLFTRRRSGAAPRRRRPAPPPRPSSPRRTAHAPPSMRR